MTHWKDKKILVVGGSAGLGAHLAKAFQVAGAHVAISARNAQRLDATASQLSATGNQIVAWPVDITDPQSVDQLANRVASTWGKLDVLVNAAGKSDRGRVEATAMETYRELLELNFLGTLRCTKALLPLLTKCKGSVINIGSLAAKTASANLGAYPSSKFPIAALSQQLRLEHAGDLHVLLVCPGPIRRDDAGSRYTAENVPESALKPGGGVHLKGIEPQYLTRRILTACQKRKAELVIPGKARLLFAISALFPKVGDWIVRRMTS